MLLLGERRRTVIMFVTVRQKLECSFSEMPHRDEQTNESVKMLPFRLATEKTLLNEER